MAITPADIEAQSFSPCKRGQDGYNTDEVDAFLEELSGEVDAMLQKIADLKSRLNSTEQQLAAANAQIASLEEQQSSAAPSTAITQPAIPTVNFNTASEEQISRVLIVAQQSADKMVDEARDNADRIRNEADQKAREVIRQALAEKQNELDEIDRLKQSREDFRSEYKKLLQHFLDDADSVFPAEKLSNTPTGSTPVRRVSSSQPSAPMKSSSVSDFGDLD